MFPFPARVGATCVVAALLVSGCADDVPFSPERATSQTPLFSLQDGQQLNVGQTRQLTTPLSAVAEQAQMPLNWASVSTAIATVSATGVVTGVAVGSTKIRAWVWPATVDTIPITVVTAQTIGTITLSPTTATKPVGQTVQVTATVKSTTGQTMTGVALNWVSNYATIATVNSSGLVTAVAVGTATISAIAGNRFGSMTVTVTSAQAGAVATVTVTLAPPSILVGQTAQGTAVAKDASGTIITGVTPTWSSTASTIATVSSSGLVSGIAAGSSSIRATVNGITGSATETVAASGGGGTAPTPAGLPQASVSTAPTPVTGQTILVHAGSNLQTALANAQRGDEIVLDAGATYTGNFVLPVKPGTAANGWITLRTNAVSSLPSPGTRIDPALHQAALATLVSPNMNAALATALTASGWRVIGLEITTLPTLSYVNYGIVTLGDGSSAQNALTKVASDLIIDRSYIHPQNSVQTKRCIGLNSARTAIVDSYVSNCKGSGFDTQAIGGWNGPGPYLIRNNRLEGAGENVMFGGSDPAIANLVPGDITITGNFLYKPRAWKSQYTVKNIVELKNAQRVLLEGNVLRNNWMGAQSGFAIVFGSVNQSGGCGWCIVQDITFRSNVLDSTSGGFNLFEGYSGAQWMRRVNISNNLMTAVGAAGLGGSARMFQVSGHLNDLAIDNNTGFAPEFYLLFGDGLPVIKNRFAFRNNVGGGATYNLHSAVAVGGAMLPLYGGLTYTFAGNVIVGSVPLLPLLNQLVPNIAAIGFTNPVMPNGDWSLLTSSAYKTGGQGGSVPGANWATVSALTNGVDR